jgi:hypothetical protein
MHRVSSLLVVGMVCRPAALPAQVVDVLAYILSANGVLPGDAELSAEPARLSQILFRAGKPGAH